MPITVEGHHDFAVLEARLAALIRETRAADPAGPLAPIAVVAPTRRLLSRLQAHLAGRFPALLNVHFLHHDALARDAAAAAGIEPPRVLPDRVLDALVGRLLRATRGPLAEYAAARPGAASAARLSLQDLREAGIDAAEALAVPGISDAGRAILRLYADYAAALQGMAAAGVADRAGSLRTALPHAASFGRRFRLVVHYGAYELIGVNLLMLRALERAGTRIVCLVPYHPEAPAFVHAGRFWTGMLGAPPAPVPGPAAATDRLFGDRLPRLYDETAAVLPPAGGRAPAGAESFAAFHAQGAAAELRETALRILALHRDRRTPLHDIAVIARSLEPYAADFGAVFDEHRLPFTTHASLGALREARAQAALRLARAGLRDYERQPLMDLLRSGLVRLDGRDPSFEAHAWDRLSRRWRVTGGHRTWMRHLPDWQAAWIPGLPEDADEPARARAEEVRERRLRQARSLAAAVGSLARALRPLARAAGWSAWSEAMANACRSLLDGFGGGAPRPGAAPDPGDAAAPGAAPDPDAVPDPGAAAVLEALAGMRDLEAAGIPFDGAEALRVFEAALAESAVPVIPGAGGETGAGGAAEGGVRVLDAMQARGLSFEAVFLIGFNADLFPRRPREDPFLRDADRLRLREALRAPLPVGAHAAGEERLLLAHLLGSARGRLTLSWQRADARGRAKVASLALREVARLVHGVPDAAAIAAHADRIAGHPGVATLEARRAHGLLPPGEARLGAALQAGSPAHLLAHRDRLPALPPEQEEGLAAGLEMLGTIDDPSPADLRFDACAGAAAPAPRAWSPSRLERLGTCPQRYFFQHVLRIEEMEEPLEGYELEPADLGLRVHALLRDLYAGLAGAGPPAPQAAQGIVDRLPEAWKRHTADLARRLGTDYPVFWEATQARWLAAIEAFLRSDLAALAEGGHAVQSVEAGATAGIDAGAGRRLQMTGRFDRVVRCAGGAIVIGDYKTSGDLEERARPRDALKGISLQLPLYVLLAENAPGVRGAPDARIDAELIGVGPDFSGAAAGASERAARARLDPRLLGEQRGGFLETLRILDALAAAGHFPLHAGRWCLSCPFQRACRRLHTPTDSRLQAAAPLRDYFALEGKSTRRPHLAGDGGGSAEDEA